MDDDFNREIATEIISGLVASMIIAKENLEQAHDNAVRQVRLIDDEISRIDEFLPDDFVKQIAEGKANGKE